jgi:hypothetical protein
MQSSLCFALLATAAALQAPMTRTQQRRVVANRAPMDLNGAKTSTALCAADDDDGYSAPKIEFDPDADGAHAASDSASLRARGSTRKMRESAPCRSVVLFVDDAFSLKPISFFPTQSAAATCGATGRTASTSEVSP